MKKLKSIYMNMKLRQKVLLYTVGLMGILALIFIWFVFSANQKIVLQRIYSVNQENSDKIEHYFDRLDGKIQELVRYLQTSISVQEMLTSGRSVDWNIDALVGDVANRDYVTYLDVYSASGVLLSSSRPKEEQEDLPQLVIEMFAGENVRQGLYWSGVPDDLANRNLMIYAPLYIGNEVKGIVRATIEPALLTDIYNFVGFNITSQVCLLNGYGRRVIPEEMSSSDYVITQTAYRKFTGEGIQDYILHQGQDTLYLYCTYLEHYDVYVVQVSRSDDVSNMMALVSYAAMILCGVFLLLFFLFANLVVNTLTKPVTKLADTMSQVAEGNLELTVPVQRHDEFGILAESFNTMIHRINELIAQNEANQRTQRRLELDALQMQITPHFLYNTLESFSSLSLIGDGETAYSMASALSGFYRHVLSDGRNLIRISEELEMVRNYLIIQSIRYADKFTYEINVPAEIMDSSIVKLTIQPLVENAIYHGIREVARRGLIRISAEVVGPDINLYIEDDGKGMDQDAWRKRDLLSEGGIGLSNVDQRLQLYFGEQYGLNIRSSLGAGTRVQIHLPNLTYGGDQNDFRFNRR